MEGQRTRNWSEKTIAGVKGLAGLLRQNKKDIAAATLVVIGEPTGVMATLSYFAAIGTQWIANNIVGSAPNPSAQALLFLSNVSGFFYTGAIGLTGISAATLTAAVVIEKETIKDFVVTETRGLKNALVGVATWARNGASGMLEHLNRA